MAVVKSGTSTREVIIFQDPNSCADEFDRVPPQKALDLFRPGWDIEQNPIPPDKQKTYTSRINITFRQVPLSPRRSASSDLNSVSTAPTSRHPRVWVRTGQDRARRSASAAYQREPDMRHAELIATDSCEPIRKPRREVD